MSQIRNIITDIYSGIFYHSLKYENADTAKKSVGMRMMALVFPYFFSIEMLFITLYVRKNGSIYMDVPLAALLVFGIFFVFYRYLIYPIVRYNEFTVGIDDNTRKKQIRICLYSFAGSIVFFIVSFILIVIIKQT